MRALGFKHLGQGVTHRDRREIRGMISTVQHLVKVEEIDDETA